MAGTRELGMVRTECWGDIVRCSVAIPTIGFNGPVWRSGTRPRSSEERHDRNEGGVPVESGSSGGVWFRHRDPRGRGRRVLPGDRPVSQVEPLGDANDGSRRQTPGSPVRRSWGSRTTVSQKAKRTGSSRGAPARGRSCRSSDRPRLSKGNFPFGKRQMKTLRAGDLAESNGVVARGAASANMPCACVVPPENRLVRCA